MPEAFDPVTDFASRAQTSIEPVQRFNLIVAAILLAPPGIISQWFVTMIASAISPAPTIVAMLCPILRICAPASPFSSTTEGCSTGRTLLSRNVLLAGVGVALLAFGAVGHIRAR